MIREVGATNYVLNTWLTAVALPQWMTNTNTYKDQKINYLRFSPSKTTVELDKVWMFGAGAVSFCCEEESDTARERQTSW